MQLIECNNYIYVLIAWFLVQRHNAIIKSISMLNHVCCTVDCVIGGNLYDIKGI